MTDKPRRKGHIAQTVRAYRAARGDADDNSHIADYIDLTHIPEPEERKPCGHFHPLPCGLDVWCPVTEWKVFMEKHGEELEE